MLGGSCSPCCDPCGSFPKFIQLSHNIPSSPSGGDVYDGLPHYCTQSFPSVLQLSRIDQRDPGRVVQIECGYTGPISVCSLPSGVFQTIAGINQIIVDLASKRLFVWYEVRIENTRSGVTQASLLYATTDNVSFESDTIATFHTQSTDGLLGSLCAIGAGYTITINKSSGPLEVSTAPDSAVAMYKDTAGRWWPGSQITVTLPSSFSSTPNDRGVVEFPPLVAADYVLTRYYSFGCAPEWRLSLPLGGQTNSFYSWLFRATLDKTDALQQANCGGCQHSFQIELSIPAYLGIHRYRSQCRNSWGGSASAALVLAGFNNPSFPVVFPKTVVVSA